MKTQRDISDPNIAKALAHPLRVRLLGILEERTASPSELAEITGAELSLVSYHVRRLAAAKLIKMVHTRQRRGAIEHYYDAVPRTTITSEAWAQVPSVAKAAMVSATLAQVGDHVTAAAVTGGFERGDAHLTRSPVTLDEQGWRQLARKMDALLEDVERIAKASDKRLKTKQHEGAIAATAVLMLFEQAPAVPDTVPAPRARRAGRSAAKTR
jgi:DNA-binding transcriptional ArsR family regulator